MDTPLFLSPGFFLYFLLFVIAFFTAVYIPGSLAIRRMYLPFFEDIVLSVIVGIVLLVLQGWTAGYLGIRWVVYVYVITANIVWWVGNKDRVIKELHRKQDIKRIKLFFFRNWLLILIFISGVFGQVYGIWPMGIRMYDGLHLSGGHVPDNILELALVNELTHRYPPYEPGMYGTVKTNYHYLSHLFFAELIRLALLPLIPTVFQYMSIVLSALYGLGALGIARMLGLSSLFKKWLLLMLYFGADGAFMALFLLRRKEIFGMSPMESGMGYLFNIPRAFSIIILFGGLYLFIRWIKDKDTYALLLCSIMFGSLVGLKVYAGIFAMSGYTFVLIYSLWRKKYIFLAGYLLALVVALGIYLPVNKSSGGLFYTGFWRTHDMLQHPVLQLGKLQEIYTVYALHNNWPKVILLEAAFLILYLFVTYGVKLIGIVQSVRSLAYFPMLLHIFFLGGGMVSFVAGMFFWQETGGPNTFNFLVVVYFIMSFYAALSLSYLWPNLLKKYYFLPVIAVLVLLIPRNFNILSSNIYSHGHYTLVNNEVLYAANYLRHFTPKDSLVLVSEGIGSESQSPEMAYLSDRPSYFSGRINELVTHGIPHKDREVKVKEMLTGNDIGLVAKTLESEGIDYVLLSGNENIPVATSEGALSLLVSNKSVKLYRVKGGRL